MPVEQQQVVDSGTIPTWLTGLFMNRRIARSAAVAGEQPHVTRRRFGERITQVHRVPASVP